MRFAFTTILNAPRFGWQPAPCKSKRFALFERARALGFDGIEWSPRWLDLFELTDHKIRELRSEAESEGLYISAINLNRFILTRCAEASENRNRVFHSVRVAKLLGAGQVIVSLSLPQPPAQSRPALIGHTISDDEFAETAEFVKRAAQLAGKHEVRLVLELHDDGLLDSSKLCLRMLELVGEPNVSINPDLGNLIRQQTPTETWREALAKLAPHTGYWHVKNYRDRDPAPIWDGDIDYVEAMQVMRGAGFDGWVSIESYFGEDVMDLQERSLSWLREVNSRATA